MVTVIFDRSQDPAKTKEEAKRLHAEGIEMFAVGVTEDVIQDELKAIASHDDNKHVYNLQDFQEFEPFIKEIQKRFSQGVYNKNAIIIQ